MYSTLAFITLIYFLGGIIYDVIVEPPSVGSTTDEHGHTRYSKERVLYQISIALDFNKWSLNRFMS